MCGYPSGTITILTRWSDWRHLAQPVPVVAQILKIMFLWKSTKFDICIDCDIYCIGGNTFLIDTNKKYNVSAFQNIKKFDNWSNELGERSFWRHPVNQSLKWRIGRTPLTGMPWLWSDSVSQRCGCATAQMEITLRTVSLMTKISEKEE